MENQNSFDILAHQNLTTQRLQLLNLQIQLEAFQKQALQGHYGGNHFHGVDSTMEGGYCYQPQFDYAPRNDFYPQGNSYLPTMMEYPDFSYGSSYPLQPDSSQFMPYPQDDGIQDSYQPYGYEIPSSQEVWQQPQEISPSLENLFMAFIQESQATFKSHEASLRNLEQQVGQIGMQISGGPNGISSNDVMVSSMEQIKSLTTSEMTSPTMKGSVEHEIFDLESVLEDHSEEEMDELTPKMNDEEFTVLEGQELLQVMREHKTIVENQVLDSKAILPSCDVYMVLNEDGLNHFIQPQKLNPIMKEVEYQEIKGSHESSSISSVLKDTSISFISIIQRYLCFKKWDPGGSHFDVCDKFFASNFKPP